MQLIRGTQDTNTRTNLELFISSFSKSIEHGTSSSNAHSAYHGATGRRRHCKAVQCQRAWTFSDLRCCRDLFSSMFSHTTGFILLGATKGTPLFGLVP